MKFLENGSLILNGLKTRSGSYGDEDLAIRRNAERCGQGTYESEQHLVYHTDVSWASEMAHFFDNIERGETRTGNSNDALNVMTLIDRIYEFRS